MPVLYLVGPKFCPIITTNYRFSLGFLFLKNSGERARGATFITYVLRFI